MDALPFESFLPRLHLSGGEDFIPLLHPLLTLGRIDLDEVVPFAFTLVRPLLPCYFLDELGGDGLDADEEAVASYASVRVEGGSIGEDDAAGGGDVVDESEELEALGAVDDDLVERGEVVHGVFLS